MMTMPEQTSPPPFEGWEEQSNRLVSMDSSLTSLGEPPRPRARMRPRERSPREYLRETCFPHGFVREVFPLSLCFLALVLTGFGSWHCSYFHGAEIGFTDNQYGLWTVMDVYGKCQLWTVIFYSYHLGPALGAARFFSMASMLIGLGMLTAMAQAVQAHVVSWGVGLVLLIMLLVSIATTCIFNIWIVFWLFTYVIMVLIVRALFIHPVHRRISERGNRAIAIFFVICHLSSLFTLVVLRSEFCNCAKLSPDDLEGRITGDPCETECRLGPAGIIMLLGSCCWLGAAVATRKIGVQPDVLQNDPTKTGSMYFGFPNSSIRTRINKTVKKVTSSIHEAVPFSSIGSNDDFRDDTEDSVPSSRSLCQKMCCDWRIKPRSRQEKCLFWLFRVMLTKLILIYLFILIVMIGSRVENVQAERAPSTSPNFITNIVCAFNPLDPGEPFVTFPNKAEATGAGYEVAHCGECAFCSNMKDIQTYVETRETIAATAKKCGPVAVLGTEEQLVNCLERRIGFSRDCTVCWSDNMLNDVKHCLFTCMNTLLTGFSTNNNVPGAGAQGWLNHCLQCDEKMSGTAFVTCSGVARRRLGIKSEIERNPAEQCPHVRLNWLTYFDGQKNNSTDAS